MVDYYLFGNEESGDERADEEKKLTIAARHAHVTTFLLLEVLAPLFLGYCTEYGKETWSNMSRLRKNI